MQTPDPPSDIASVYVQIIWELLDADLCRSALFYAERYYVHDPGNHDARHLYALTLLRACQPHSALYLVDLPADVTCLSCLDIKSRCCINLGRHGQAREAMEKVLAAPSYQPSGSMRGRNSAAFSDIAAMHCKSGTASMKGKLHREAGSSFRQALSKRYIMWEAFEGLCTLGEFPEIDELFPPKPILSSEPTEPPPVPPPIPLASGAGFFTPDASNRVIGWMPVYNMQNPRRESIATVADSSFGFEDSFHKADLRPSRSQPIASLGIQSPAVRPLSSADETGPVHKKPRSTLRPKAASSSILTSDSNIRASKSAGASLQGADRVTKMTSTSRTTNVAPPTKTSKEQQAPAMTRRSSRLLAGPSTKPPIASKVPTIRERRRPLTLNSKSPSDSEMDEEPPPRPIFNGPSTSAPQVVTDNDLYVPPVMYTGDQISSAQKAEEEVYNLTRTFARATRYLAQFESKACLEELEKLPQNHQKSASVMSMVARAHYELAEYAEAQRAFEAVRNLEPYRLTDMEVFSTLMWHQQKSVSLSFLAQELLTINPKAPEAWIAVGNCFSLQKERAQALACFRRATQMDPDCAYAYTLSGHETIDEDMEKAIKFFQDALRADPRHYNAWYGLGTCYMRMNKLRLADYHYRKAVLINSYNAVLLGCVGMVDERRGLHKSALDWFNAAVWLSPDNALVRYHRAKILIATKKYPLAVKDLEALRSMSPDESNVIFQLARVYRLMGNKVKSAELLAAARDVSPKSMNKIRKLLETVKDETSDDVMDEG